MRVAAGAFMLAIFDDGGRRLEVAVEVAGAWLICKEDEELEGTAVVSIKWG